MQDIDSTHKENALAADAVAQSPLQAAVRPASFSGWFGLSAQSRRLLWMYGAVLLVMSAAIVVTIFHMRKSALYEAGLEASKLSVAIAEQTSLAISRTDLVLRRLHDLASGNGLNTPESFQAYFGTINVNRELLREKEELPQVRAFAVVGADGHGVNTSRLWPEPHLDLSHRDYFQYLHEQDDGGVFVSEPAVNPYDGHTAAYIARRINAPDGRFLGIVLAVLDMDYFVNLYKLISPGDISVSLIRKDGIVLTRYPVVSGQHRVPEGSLWYANVARGGGLYESAGMVGDTSRLMSVHTLANYPIVISVGISYAHILASWRGEAVFIGGSMLCAIICIGLLLQTTLVQLQRLGRSEAFLVTQNENLHQAQERTRVQSAALLINQIELAEKTAALELTLETMDQGLITVTADGHISIYNRRVEEMLDLPAGWLATKPLFAEMVAYQRRAGEFNVPGQQIPIFISSGLIPQHPFRYERVRPNGLALEVHSIPLKGGGMVRTVTDITDRRRSEEQIRHFARHDSLTQLVNRVVFQECLQEAIDVAGNAGHAVAVLCLDLDRFKLVNDTRGHATGDKLLAEVSARLRSIVRQTDTVARMGGDEFAIVQTLIDEPEQSEQLADRLLDLISQPYVIDGAPALIGVSIGIARHPEHGTNPSALLHAADTALYQAKADGRGVFRIFEESMEAAQRDTFQLEQEIGQALSLGQLDLAYQPIVDAATRNILAFEVLLRWNHPTRGLVTPAEFIPLAEMSGSIVPIGLWVLEAACAEAATWPSDVRLSVNWSPAQFRQGDLLAQVGAVLARTGLNPDRLSLEVTEGLLLDGTRQVLGTMEALRALGVRFSLDDFGTAHSGLSYLRCFPFDAIKIDKSFVQDAVARPESRAIVKTILAMGNVLKLNVIAEGVETEEQLKLLRQLRCRQVQGYLTGRPVPADTARDQIQPAPAAPLRQLAAAGD